jgi:V/A-type H+-transporting ATPase subunit C
MHYLRAARLIPFGESGVISYLLARENELTAVRIILLGRMAGLSEEQITERLR